MKEKQSKSKSWNLTRTEQTNTALLAKVNSNLRHSRTTGLHPGLTVGEADKSRSIDPS